MNASALDRFQHAYETAYRRDDEATMDRLNAAWDAAIDKAEQLHDGGLYSDEEVASIALED